MRTKITQADIDRFAQASGDRADLHRPKENETPIAHGMYLMGIALSMYNRIRPTRWIRSYEMKFVRPVHAETEIDIRYTETENRIEVTLSTKQGETVAKGVFDAE